MSHFTKAQVKEELKKQQTEEGFMSDEIHSCSFVEEEKFFSIQYGEDESGVVGDRGNLLAKPILGYGGKLEVDLPVLEVIEPTSFMVLPSDVITDMRVTEGGDDLLEREGIPLPLGHKTLITGSLRSYNYLLEKGICKETDRKKHFICSP